MEELIKREDAIEAIEFGITYAKMICADGWTKPLFENENRELRKAIERIKDIPSAEKQGEWITEEMDSIYGKKIRLKCSECGDTFDVSEKAFPYERFCRYCGARMK